jgi:PDZ domain-containing secreted protein
MFGASTATECQAASGPLSTVSTDNSGGVAGTVDVESGGSVVSTGGNEVEVVVSSSTVVVVALDPEEEQEAEMSANTPTTARRFNVVPLQSSIIFGNKLGLL